MSPERGDRVVYLAGVLGWPCAGTVEAVEDTGFGITLASVRRDTTSDVEVTDQVDVDELLPEGASESELAAHVRSIY
jgi:hypothetical protein